ncbi:hypothetical protein RHMOL_Rhmol13G0111700 [Rhododendron molle]|uniref:Uncharacterized protein n=1 Tax=Rhododendron molle TaxID=49168 RepID=A0ACC0L6D5_RHOML|nr:hypothetical protein RHMOL_Rhmol13G0111700 [Rhododendron molle]
MGMEEGPSPCDGEAQAAQLGSQAFDRQQQRGSWITFPFIAGCFFQKLIGEGGTSFRDGFCPVVVRWMRPPWLGVLVVLRAEVGRRPIGALNRAWGCQFAASGLLLLPLMAALLCCWGATMAGLTLAAGGWINNLIVFLIGEFNVKSIEAAQLWNVVNGCTSMFPVLGAIVADSFLGNFSVICISSLFSLLVITIRVCMFVELSYFTSQPQ